MSKFLFVELTEGSRLHLPEVDDALADAVAELHEVDDTVFGDPDAAVELTLPGGGTLSLKAADLADVVTGASVAF